jgi:hypothetical protein
VSTLARFVIAILPIPIGLFVIGISLAVGFGIGVIVGAFFILGDIFLVVLIFREWNSPGTRGN